MKDYFDNLVTRTLHPETTARPRLAALFEPATQLGQTPPVEEAELVDDSREIPATAPQPTPSQRTELSPVERKPLTESTDTPSALAEQHAVVPPVKERRSTNEQPSLINPVVPQPAASLLIPPPLPRAPQLPAPASLSQHTTDPPRDTQRANSIAPTIPVADPHPQPSEQQPLETLIKPEHEAPKPAPSQVVRPAIHRERAAQKEPPDEPSALIEERTSSAAETVQDVAPTIKISIGRVEVRAVMTSQPTPRPAPERRPVLSLDDYLKQRSGGKG